MRKVLLLAVAGLMSSPAFAEGYWGGEDTPGRFPIESVLDQAVPQDDCWKIRISERLRGMPVTAPPASLEWRDRLKAMAAYNKVEVAILDADCIVAVRPQVALPPVQTGDVQTTTAVGAPAAPVAAAGPGVNSVAAGVVATLDDPEKGTPIAVPAFTLKRGGSLRGQVGEWVSKSGWSLAWELKYDYPVAADASFGHDLFEAVERLSQSYERIGEMRDVEWVFNNGNRVLAVRAVDRFMHAGRQARSGVAK